MLKDQECFMLMAKFEKNSFDGVFIGKEGQNIPPKLSDCIQADFS